MLKLDALGTFLLTQMTSKWRHMGQATDAARTGHERAEGGRNIAPGSV
jgi:hypothetical protein